MQTKAKHKRIAQKVGKNTRAGIIRKKRFEPTATKNQDSIQPIGLPALAVKKSIHAAEVFGLSEIHHAPQQILDDVLPAYLNYVSLCGEKLVELKGTATEQLCSIHLHLSKLVKREYSKAAAHYIFNKELQTHFLNIAGYYENTTNCVYILPLYFLQLLEERNSVLFQPMLDFFRLIRFKTGFTDWDNNPFMEFIDDALLNIANEDADDNPSRALDLIANSRQYSEKNGIANVWLKRLKQKQIFDLSKSFADAVAKLKVEEDEEFLREWLLAGWVALKHPDSRPIAHFQCDDEFNMEDMQDGEPVELEDTFGFLYREDDAYCAEYVSWIQMHAIEFSNYSAMSSLVITSATKEKYRHNKWFMDFIDWLTSGIVAINRFIEKYGEPFQTEIHL